MTLQALNLSNSRTLLLDLVQTCYGITLKSVLDAGCHPHDVISSGGDLISTVDTESQHTLVKILGLCLGEKNTLYLR